MSCELVQGAEIGCRDNVGGVQVIYIANFDNVQNVTSTSGIISQ